MTPRDILDNAPLCLVCKPRFKNEPEPRCVSLEDWEGWMSVWCWAVSVDILAQISTYPDWPSLFQSGHEEGSWASGRSDQYSFRDYCGFFCGIAKYAFAKKPHVPQNYTLKNNKADEKNNFGVMSLFELISWMLFRSGMASFFCKESDEVRLCGPRGKIELFCRYFITREKPICTHFIKK